jgi:hypothetical protein
VGNELKWSGTAWWHEQAASVALPGRHLQERRMTLEATLLETRHSWQVVADLPFKEGATARWGDTYWRIARRPLNYVGSRELGVEIGHGQVWFGKRSRRWANAGGNDSLALVDRTAGIVISSSEQQDLCGVSEGGLRSLTTALSHQRRAFYVWPEDAPVDGSHDIRLVVLRPTVVRQILHPWRPPEPVIAHVAVPSS